MLNDRQPFFDAIARHRAGLPTRPEPRPAAPSQPTKADQPPACVHLGRSLEVGACATKRRKCKVYGECSVKPNGVTPHHCRHADGSVACDRFEDE